MTDRPAITADELYPSDLARLEAIRPHGYVAALWRMPGRPGRYSVVGITDTEARFRKEKGNMYGDECVFVPVAELLGEIGE